MMHGSTYIKINLMFTVTVY